MCVHICSITCTMCIMCMCVHVCVCVCFPLSFAGSMRHPVALRRYFCGSYQQRQRDRAQELQSQQLSSKGNTPRRRPAHGCKIAGLKNEPEDWSKSMFHLLGAVHRLSVQVGIFVQLEILGKSELSKLHETETNEHESRVSVVVLGLEEGSAQSGYAAWPRFRLRPH